MARPKPCLGCRALTINNPARCATCRARHDKARGTREQRGYGTAHRQLRKDYEPLVRSGRAICWRCTKPIDPAGDWDLGHDDADPTRTRYRGPEHVACNRATAGR